MEEMRKSRDDIRLRLRKKEWEYESRVMERDQQRANVEKLKVKMNRKAAELNESWNREQEMQERFTRLQQQVGQVSSVITVAIHPPAAVLAQGNTAGMARHADIHHGCI